MSGKLGGVNGHSWTSANEVHIALNDETPLDSNISFLEQGVTTTLSEGSGSYSWGQKTVKYKIDEFPTLAEGQPETAVASVSAGSAYSINLSALFTDEDENDSISYRVKLNGGNMSKVKGDTYSYTPANPGTYTLEFFAYDGFVYSKECYTVTLTAVNLSETFDVTVKNLPEGAEFYYNNGFNADGTDILGGKLDAEYKDGAYTVKVPENVTCIAIALGDYRITAEVSSEDESSVISMHEVTFTFNTRAGDRIAGTVTLRDKNYHMVTGKGVTYYLISGDTYTVISNPGNNYSQNWSGKNINYIATSEAKAEENIIFEVRSPKTITIDADAELQVVYQNGYYVLQPVEAQLEKDNGDGTVTYTYSCHNSSAYALGYMYFAKKDNLIDKAGYMKSGSSYTVTWDGESRTSSYRGSNDPSLVHTRRTDDSILVNVNKQNHLILNEGETFRLRSFRIWEIIDTDTENVMIEPEFIYDNYDKNIISLVSANEKLLAEKGRVCGTGGNNWMDMTATGKGVTFLEVSYEAVHIVSGYAEGSWGGANGQPGNYTYSASDPARTALIVVQTDGKAATDIDFGIECFSANGTGEYYDKNKSVSWDAEFDTLYFLGEKGEMKLSPSTKSGEIASVAVSADKGEAWKTLKAEDGIYTTDIYSGNNIIRVTKADGTTAYQIVRGDKITYDVNLRNDLDADGEIDPGDTVRVKLNGLHNPIGKMSGVYNPGYSFGQHVNYTWNDGNVRQSGLTQYDFVTNAWVDVTIPEDAKGDYFLEDGYINFNVFGDSPGNHRNLTDNGRPVNMSAESTSYTRSILPDILIYEAEMPEEADLMGDVNHDGEIDSNDAAMIISYYYGDVVFDEKQIELADVTKDGEVDTNDAGKIISFYYGNINSL